MSTEAIVAGLVGLLGTLLGFSTKRELSLKDKQIDELRKDLAASTLRVTALEIAQAAHVATATQRDRRMDEVIAEIGEVRSMLQEILKRLPSPEGSHQ